MAFLEHVFNCDKMGREVDTLVFFGFRISILVSGIFDITFSLLHDVIVVCTQLIKLKRFCIPGGVILMCAMLKMG